MKGVKGNRVVLRSFCFLALFLFGCAPDQELHPVTVKEFKKFIDETNYVTDAEKFGWSFVQNDIFDYEIKEGISWRNPTGEKKTEDNFPVTQVSYNDALAYCKWANTQLPEYVQYWNAVKSDPRKINMNSEGIRPVKSVNIVGNVWDITTTENQKGEIRLAGGSYLCSKETCNGSNPERKRFVDKTTGNSNIGFSILK